MVQQWRAARSCAFMSSAWLRSNELWKTSNTFTFSFTFSHSRVRLNRMQNKQYQYNQLLKASARVAKLADARDLKSRVPKGTYRFNSGPGHHIRRNSS
jgi:hypothetical protein